MRRLQRREDYVHFVETLYFGAMQAGNHAAVLAHFAPDAVLTGYAGDSPARVMARVPGPGQSSLDDFMAAGSRFDLTYRDFVHFVDVEAQRVASYFSLLLRPKRDPDAPFRCLKNCNFFQFGDGRLVSVVAYFADPGDQP